MTNERQNRANQANAQAATGPRTSAGKARSARNAFRHGLNSPVTFDPALGRQVEDLARRIVGDGTDLALLDAARRIAEAQTQLQRVQALKLRLIGGAYGDPSYQPRAMSLERSKAAIAVLSGRSMTLGKLKEMRRNLEGERPQGPVKLAAILNENAAELARLDRYERRALSRHKFAIRDFDAWRRQSDAGVRASGVTARCSSR